MPPTTQHHTVTVDDGGVPVFVAAHEHPILAPGVVVVPSIYGPAADLLERMAGLADVATTVVLDPFWREGGGAVDYRDRDAAIGRLAGFEPGRSMADVRAVADWVRARTNGDVIGVGICFGGPFVVRGAADGWLAGAATWHGSRIQNMLDELPMITAPLRMHFGSADAAVPPDALAAIQAHFADHPDCRITVHDGAEHGFSMGGPAYDADAAAASYASLRELVSR